MNHYLSWESKENSRYLILYVPTIPYVSKLKCFFVLSFSTKDIRLLSLNTWLNSCGLFEITFLEVKMLLVIEFNRLFFQIAKVKWLYRITCLLKSKISDFWSCTFAPFSISSQLQIRWPREWIKNRFRQWRIFTLIAFLSGSERLLRHFKRVTDRTYRALYQFNV